MAFAESPPTAAAAPFYSSPAQQPAPAPPPPPPPPPVTQPLIPPFHPPRVPPMHPFPPIPLVPTTHRPIGMMKAPPLQSVPVPPCGVVGSLTTPPPPPLPTIALVPELYEAIENPCSLYPTADDLLTTCCVCGKENVMLTIRMDAVRESMNRQRQLIEFLKNNICFVPMNGTPPTSTSAMAPIPLDPFHTFAPSAPQPPPPPPPFQQQQPPPVHPSTQFNVRSNLSVEANEFLPSSQIKRKNSAEQPGLSCATASSTTANAVDDSAVNGSTATSTTSATATDKKQTSNDSASASKRKSLECEKKTTAAPWSVPAKSSSRRNAAEERPSESSAVVESNNSKDSRWLPQTNGDRTTAVIEEMEGDLFTVDAEYSLAHCVAEDFRMGAGIAVQFKKEFGMVAELLDQGKCMGEVAILEKERGRYVYYLVTKKFSYEKPKMEDLRKSLVMMADHCSLHGVTKLAMPLIGCGLDRLQWPDVKKEVVAVFANLNIQILVYYLKENKSIVSNGLMKTGSPSPAMSGPAPSKSRLNGPRVYELTHGLEKIEAGTALLVYGSLDGHMSRAAQRLDRRWNFAAQYQSRAKKSRVGEMLVIKCNGEEYVYVLLVKRTHDEPLRYVDVRRCLTDCFVPAIREYGLWYVGVDDWEEPFDHPLQNEKLLTVLRSYLPSSVNLYVCGRKQRTNSATANDHYHHHQQQQQQQQQQQHQQQAQSQPHTHYHHSSYRNTATNQR